MAFRAKLVAGVVGALAVMVAIGAQTASADTTGNWYYLQGKLNGGPSAYAKFGGGNDEILVGDWNGDGRDTLMIRRGNAFYVTNSATGGATAYSFRYGSGGDVVIVGDWNGDGRDTLGVRRGNRYFLTDSVRGGVATHVFTYGSGGDQLIVGDWNGDRRDTFGVRRANQYFLTNREGGVAEVVAKFGSGGDTVIVGDWNRDKRDSLGVRRGNAYHLANAIAGGRTNVINTFGSSQDTSYVGDWNGDGVDTVAVRRSFGPPRSYSGNATYAVGRNFAPGLYKGSVASDAGCYWERAGDFSGDIDSVIANYFEIGPVSPIYVEVRAGDTKFDTQDCGRWTEARSTDAARYIKVDDGQYRVGKDLAAGIYQASGGSSCYWETLSSFDGEFDSLIANDFGASRPIVSVGSDVFGFQSSSCGTWTRIGAERAVGAGAKTAGPDATAFAERQRDALTHRP